MQAAGLLMEDGKRELIDGEIIDLPSESDSHMSLRVALNRSLILQIADDLRVASRGTLRLSETDWPEPDFYVRQASTRPGDIHGADVLLVIEISDTTLAHDLGGKADLYRRHGVCEYWVIDVNARRLHVHRADGAWPSPAVPLTDIIEPALIPGLRLRIADFLPD
ncbi:MAG TPA: Uma2 family endonuclease [Caulobacteraceae bacterium]|jgi:Uma2 family endonuclease